MKSNFLIKLSLCIGILVAPFSIQTAFAASKTCYSKVIIGGVTVVPEKSLGKLSNYKCKKATRARVNAIYFNKILLDHAAGIACRAMGVPSGNWASLYGAWDRTRYHNHSVHSWRKDGKSLSVECP